MVNSNNIGDNRIIRGDNRDAGALTEVVETIRLDDYLKKNGSFDILMKIIENNYKRFICIHEGESNAPIDVHFIKNYCAKYEKEWFDVFMIKD